MIRLLPPDQFDVFQSWKVDYMQFASVGQHHATWIVLWFEIRRNFFANSLFRYAARLESETGQIGQGPATTSVISTGGSSRQPAKMHSDDEAERNSLRSSGARPILAELRRDPRLPTLLEL